MSHKPSAGARRSLTLAILGLKLGLGAVAPAAVRTWDGGSASSSNWSEGSNWDGIIFPQPPTENGTDDIHFAGSTRLSNIIDAATTEWHINSLTFDAGSGAFVLSGDALRIDAGITNNDNSTQTIDTTVIMAASFAINAASGGLVIEQLRLENRTATIAGAFNTTINSVRESAVGAGGSIIKNGTGILTINSALTANFDGTVTINDGTLAVGGGSAIPDAVNVTVSSPGIFDLNSSETIGALNGNGTVNTSGLILTVSGGGNFTGVIQGTGGLTKTGANTLILGGANTYTGPTTISAGTLQLSASNRLANSTDVSVASGATLDLNNFSDAIDQLSGLGTVSLGSGILTIGANNGSSTFDGVISGTGGIIKDGTGNLTLTGNNTYSGSTSVNGGALLISQSTNLGSGDISLGGGTLRFTSDMLNGRPIQVTIAGGTLQTDSIVTQTATISGTGTLTKTGAGALLLSATSTHNGLLDIDQGTVRLAASHRLDDISDIDLAAGAFLDLNGFSDAVDLLTGAGTVQTGGGTLTVAKSVLVLVTFSGQITGTGGLTKTGAHTMELSGDNTYTGATTINNGILRLAGAGQLSSSTDVTVNGGGTFDTNGLDPTIDALAGAGTVQLGAGGTVLTIGANNATSGFSGVITGTGSLVKTGTGTLTLTGNNTFSGQLTINGGMVAANSNNALGFSANTLNLDNGALRATADFSLSRPVNLQAGGGTFEVNSGITLTAPNAIGGAGGLTKSGLGTMVLGNSGNSYTGTTLVSAGTLQVANVSGALPNTTDVTVAAGATLALNGVGSVLESIDALDGAGNVIVSGSLTLGTNNGSGTFSGVISGSGVNKNGTGTQTLSGPNTFTGVLQISGGTLNIAPGGSLASSLNVTVFAPGVFDLDTSIAIGTLSGDGSVVLANNAILTTNPTFNASFSGPISGAGGLTKTGGNTLTLGGLNPYTGATRVNGGVLRVSQSANLGDAANSLILNAGTLETTASFTNPRAVTLEGAGTMDVNDTFTLTQSGAISGAGSLTKADLGTLVLAAANTYTGTTTINAGTAMLQGAGQLPDTTTVTVSPGATLDLNGVSDTIDGLSGGGIVLFGGATLTVGASNATSTFSGTISEAGTLTKTGTGALTLTGANAHTSTRVQGGGILAISASSSLGGPAGPLFLDNGTLSTLATLGIPQAVQISSGQGTVDVSAATTTTISGAISGAGLLTKRGDGTLVLTGSNIGFSGGMIIDAGTLSVATNTAMGANTSPVTIHGATLIATAAFSSTHPLTLGDPAASNVVQVDAGTLTWNASLIGTGGLVKTGAGGLRLNSVNTFAGPVLISGGELRVGASSIIPNTTDVTANGTLNVQGVIEAIDSLDGTGVVQLDPAAPGAGTSLIVGQSGGNGGFSGVIQGFGTFTKSGAGTQILSGVNTWAGGLTVNGGTLEVAASANLGDNSVAITLSNGTLRTTGTFTNPRAVSILSPIGSFDVAAATTLTQDGGISGAGSLRKIGGGTLVLRSAATHTGQTLVTDGTLQLAAAGSLPDDTFVTINSPGVWDLADIDDTIGSLNGDGTVLLGGAALTTGTLNSLSTFSGSIQGLGTFVKVGNGTQVLSGNNTYTGATHMLAGSLSVSADQNLGGPGTVLLLNGGTLWATDTFASVRSLNVEAGNGRVQVDPGKALTLSGAITGVGLLTKVGQGELILSGSSSYTGGNVVLAGTLTAGANANLGAAGSPLNIDGGTFRASASFTLPRDTFIGVGNAAISVDNAAVLTHTGIISGVPTTSLTKSGPGDLLLQGNNIYAGRWIIDAGQLQVSTFANLGSAASLVSLSGGTLSALASFTNSRGIEVDPADAGAISVATGITLTQTGVVANGAGTVGPAPLQRLGAGTLVLQANNTFTRPLLLLAGTTRLSGAGRLADVVDVTVADGATLHLDNVSDTIDALNGDGNIDITGGTLTVGGDFGSGGFTGVIHGTGALVKAGGGIQVLRRKVGPGVPPELHNTYTGGTTISGGILSIHDNQNLGDPAGPITFNNGTLRIVPFGLSNGSVVSNRPVTLGFSGGTIDTEDQALSLFRQNTPITGSGGLTKTGPGRLQLDGANTYAGQTLISGGDLETLSDHVLPDTTSVIVNSPARLRINGHTDDIDGLNGNGEVFLGNPGGTDTLGVGANNSGGTHTGPITGSGNLKKLGIGSQLLRGNNTFTGAVSVLGGLLDVQNDANFGGTANPVTINGGTLHASASFAAGRSITTAGTSGALGVASGATLTLNGPLVLNGLLTYIGPGTLLLNSAASGTANIFNHAFGTVRLGNHERLLDIHDLFISDGAVLDLNNFNESIDALHGGGSVLLGSGKLRIGTNNGGGTFAGAITGTGDLVKDGTGTQVINGGNHTFSGATTVDNGILTLSSAASIPSNTTGLVAFNIGSSATMNVQGNWAMTGQLVVGFDGTGVLNVNGGGTVTATNVAVGFSAPAGPLTGGIGTINLGGAGAGAGTGMLTATQGLFIGGTTGAAGGTGTVNVLPGGTINASQKIRVWPQGTLRFSGGAVSTPLIEVQGVAETTVAVNVPATMQVQILAGGLLRLNQGAGGATASRIGALSISGSPGAWTGMVDITDNDLVLPNGNLATVIDQVKSGWGGAKNWFGGSGIRSSVAAADPNQAMGIAVILNNDGSGNPLFASFGGVATPLNAVILKHTYYGDADLNGRVDIDDYFRIDRGLALGLTGYRNGDFDYSGGPPNADDYFLIDRGFLGQTGPLAAAPIAPAATVPEPSALLLLAAGGALLRRRLARQRPQQPPTRHRKSAVDGGPAPASRNRDSDRFRC